MCSRGTGRNWWHDFVKDTLLKEYTIFERSIYTEVNLIKK